MNDKEKFIINQMRNKLLNIANRINDLYKIIKDVELREQFLDKSYEIVKIVGMMREKLVK